MAISIECIPIAAERFTITVSLILLRYTVVRTVVRSRVRGTVSVGGTQPYTINFKPSLGTGKKPKVKARAAELNAEPELFQFIANITYLIKSKAQKYHILRNQHENLS